MRMKIPNLNSQVRIMINKLNSYIRIVIHELVCTTVGWIMMWHHKYIRIVVHYFHPQIGVVVNNLNTQIGVMVNDFNFAIKRKNFSIRSCNRASVFVNCQIVPTFNGLSSGGLTY